MNEIAYLAAIGGCLLGFTVARLHAQRRELKLTTDNARLSQKVEDLNHSMSDVVQSVSGQVFDRMYQKAGAHNEQSVRTLISPILETLEKTDAHIKRLDKERDSAFGSVRELMESVRQTTDSLDRTLRQSDVRGRWGEVSLRRIVELAGMSNHVDFFEQESKATDDGGLRPDMVIRMPENREVIVDSKAPARAYMDAVEASTERGKKECLERHARHVGERIRELSSKSYWAGFKKSPDFVILFFPGDQFLNAALEIDPDLMENAMRNKVVLATPSSLMALLRAIAFGWRQQDVAANSEEIRELGAELYTRVATFTDHLSKLGGTLSNSVAHFNKAVGSLERSVLPSARKFRELGIDSKKEVAEIDVVDKQPRLPG